MKPPDGPMHGADRIDRSAKVSAGSSILRSEARKLPLWWVPVILSACSTSPTSINRSCNVVPLMACGTPRPNLAPAHWYYGYTENAPIAMRLTAPGGSTDGPGNFRLIQLGRLRARVLARIRRQLQPMPGLGKAILPPGQ